MNYNNKRESFPDLLVANNMGFRHADLLELEDRQARKPVSVNF
jgi:LemA protein